MYAASMPKFPSTSKYAWGGDAVTLYNGNNVRWYTHVEV